VLFRIVGFRTHAALQLDASLALHRGHGCKNEAKSASLTTRREERTDAQKCARWKQQGDAAIDVMQVASSGAARNHTVHVGWLVGYSIPLGFSLPWRLPHSVLWTKPCTGVADNNVTQKRSNEEAIHVVAPRAYNETRGDMQSGCLQGWWRTENTKCEEMRQGLD
jgi:hypothetical protein